MVSIPYLPYLRRYHINILHEQQSKIVILVFNNYNKSLFSTLYIDNTANPKDTIVSISGNTALSAIVKSPTFACVRKISKNEVIIAAFEEFTAIPTNNAIKLMLTITKDFNINWI